MGLTLSLQGVSSAEFGFSLMERLTGSPLIMHLQEQDHSVVLHACIRDINEHGTLATSMECEWKCGHDYLPTIAMEIVLYKHTISNLLLGKHAHASTHT